jgi:hypothetical protein
MATQNISNNGVSFTSLLTILFIGLKLGHIIEWSWIWVLSPIWISFGIVILIFIVVFLFFIAREVIKGIKEDK